MPEIVGRKTLGYVLLSLVALAWFVYLAPTSVGGGTSYIRVSGHSMDPTYATGDVVIQREQDSYEVGDIVGFRAQGGQVIHRIVGGNGTDGYVMQGDNKPDIDPWYPTNEDVIGKSWLRLPGAGRYVDILATPLVAGVVGGLVALAVIDTSSPPARKRRRRRVSSGRGA